LGQIHISTSSKIGSALNVLKTFEARLVERACPVMKQGRGTLHENQTFIGTEIQFIDNLKISKPQPFYLLHNLTDIGIRF
jgi:hypothetical protein